MEIDVSKCYCYVNGCDYYNIKTKKCRIPHYTDDIKFVSCKCEEVKNCYYKQLQQLKQENEELKELVNKKCGGEIVYELCETKQKLEKIKDLCDEPETFLKYFEDSEGLAEEIIQIIESEK